MAVVLEEDAAVAGAAAGAVVLARVPPILTHMDIRTRDINMEDMPHISMALKSIQRMKPEC